MSSRDAAPHLPVPGGAPSAAYGAPPSRDAPLPSISVIVPTFDRPRELAICIAALAALDYPADRYEVIVVDDGSDPPATPITSHGRPGLRITWLRQPNRGPSAARNLGARHATGTILAFTDDDCAPARDWLAAVAAAQAAAPATLHGGKIVNALPDNGCAVASQAITDVVVPSLVAAGSPLRFVTSNNLALCAERFRALGGFDESFRTAEDRELCLRWVAAGHRLALAPRAVVYHLHDLTLASYWRQHFGYGRGAFHFHRLRAARTRVPFRPDLALVRKTFRQPFATLPLRAALRIAMLLVVSHLANAAGYLWQRTVGERPGAPTST